MAQAATIGDGAAKLPRSALIKIALISLGVLLVLSCAISLAGRWFGHSISMAGHTDSTKAFEVVIGNNVIQAPANAIRFDHARRDGIAQRLDLYLRWPDLAGYSDDYRDDFNNVGVERRIIFASLEPRLMSRDMSGRFEPIYDDLIEKQGQSGPADLTIYSFTAKSGYANEQLVVGKRAGRMPFVTRCLTGVSAEQSLAPCQRDVDVGDNLSLSYRFPASLLPEWRDLDTRIVEKTRSMIKTSRN